MRRNPEAPPHLNEITHDVIAAAIAVHKALGPGLLERVYQSCLVRKLSKMGRRAESEVPIPLEFEGEKLAVGFRADVIVEGSVVVEVKSVKELSEVHIAQMSTYLKLTGCRLGLLINFNTRFLRDGVRRVILTRSDPPSAPLRSLREMPGAREE